MGGTEMGMPAGMDCSASDGDLCSTAVALKAALEVNERLEIADHDAECEAMEREIKSLKAHSVGWFCLGLLCGAIAMAVCEWVSR
jgi:hypothetical protein